MTVKLPTYAELLGPTLRVLRDLGGSGSIDEVNDGISQMIGATQEQLDQTYPKSGGPILTDRMSWARSWLKAPGYISNPSRGVWVLEETGREVADKSVAELKKLVFSAYKTALAAKKAAEDPDDTGEQPETAEDSAWSDQLLLRIQALDPSTFERLCQRLLRASGFIRVEVSGKSGDGGIDGAGVLRMNLISFQVLFQCKRWKSSVGSEVVRNFRGAMQGRADKGLIITTGTFTLEAKKEATRDGAPAIDLIDGEALCLLLKDLRLGVRVETRTVEDITLDEKFFSAI